LRTLKTAVEHSERRHRIRKCSYSLRFQHIPHSKALAARVLLAVYVQQAPKTGPPPEAGFSNGGSIMTTAISIPYDTVTFAASGLTELVRGNEECLLGRLSPLVRRESVVLDLGYVERIDAAGIAALISLYGRACEAGHSFSVANPSPHVAEILALVGLDRILLSHIVGRESHSGPFVERPAA
jgi:anti-anti-sigma factor